MIFTSVYIEYAFLIATHGCITAFTLFSVINLVGKVKIHSFNISDGHFIKRFEIAHKIFVNSEVTIKQVKNGNRKQIHWPVFPKAFLNTRRTSNLPAGGARSRSFKTPYNG